MNPDICMATADCYDLNYHNTDFHTILPSRFSDGKIVGS